MNIIYTYQEIVHRIIAENVDGQKMSMMDNAYIDNNIKSV